MSEHPVHGEIREGDVQCRWCDKMQEGRLRGRIIHENMERYGARVGECPTCLVRYHALARHHGHATAERTMTRQSPRRKRMG